MLRFQREHKANSTSNLGTDFVTIHVGNKRKEFMVHKKPICDTMSYLRKDFTGAFKEREGVIHLPEESPSAFALLIDWLYRSTVPAGTSVEYFIRLHKLHVLAEKLCLHELANKTMVKILKMSNRGRSSDDITITPALVSYIYSRTFIDSPFRRYCIEELARSAFSLETSSSSNSGRQRPINHLKTLQGI